MATNNAINANAAGLVRYNGTGIFDAVTTTDHNVLVGATSNGVTNVSPSTAGFVFTSNGVSSDPSFQALPIPGVIPTMTFISAQTASASANITFTGIDNTYPAYRIIFNSITLSAASTFQIRFSTDAFSTTATFNGSTYNFIATGTTIYQTVQWFNLLAVVSTSTLVNGQADILYPGVSTVQTMTNGFCTGLVSTTSGNTSASFQGSDTVRQTIDSIRFSPTAGTITSGTFNLYGLS